MRLLLAILVLLLAGFDTGADARIRQRDEKQAAINSEAAFRDWFERYTARRQSGPLAPRNDCGAIPGANAFHRGLARSIWRNKPLEVAGLASPDVQLGFGGEQGKTRFLASLRAGNGAGMRELRALLPLGCAPDGQGGLILPWYFAQDMGEADQSSAMVVTGAGVPLRKAANPRGLIKARLDWQLVELIGGLQQGSGWQHVRTTGGTEGYVQTAMLRSVLATRVVATRRNGQWRISAVTKGD